MGLEPPDPSSVTPLVAAPVNVAVAVPWLACTATVLGEPPHCTQPAAVTSHVPAASVAVEIISVSVLPIVTLVALFAS